MTEPIASQAPGIDVQGLASAIAVALAPLFESLTAALALPGDVPPPLSTDASTISEMHDEPAARVRFEQTLPAKLAEQQRLEDAHDNMAVQVSRLRYERAFDGLEKEGVAFDRQAEFAALIALPEPLRDAHIERMRNQYKRSPVGQLGYIETADPLDLSAPNENERKAVIEFAVKHGLTDISIARARYRAEQTNRI